MIKNIVDLLTIGDFYGETKKIDFAKGANELPTTWKGTWKLIKRIVHGRKSRN